MKRFIATLLVFYAVTAQAQFFTTPLTKSHWKVKSSAFACSLTHPVEGFGNWTISRKSNQAEVAQLKLDSKLTAKKNIHLAAVRYKVSTAPPAWKPQEFPEDLGEVNLTKSDSELVFSSSVLTRIVQALEKSKAVVVLAQDAMPLRVQLQPYRFNESYEQYKSCVAQLITYSFDQITRNTLYYQTDEKKLSSANKIILDKIVRYMKADPGRILKVLVDGHSDVQADPALAESLAKNQAEWVANYLKEKGLSEDKLVVRSHADKYPVANNFLLKDRVKNRRVTVRLEDESIQRKNAEKIAELKKLAEERATAKSATQATSSVASSTSESSPEFGDKLPIELELEKMIEGQVLEGAQPSELPSP